MTDAAQHDRIALGAWLHERLEARADTVKIGARGLDLFVVRELFDDAECAELIALIDANATRSLVMGHTDDPDYRTSESCNLDQNHPAVAEVEARIGDVMGLAYELGEQVQGQRYGPGQQFKPHFEYFVPTEPYWPQQQRMGGQRTWTAMLYLNAPDEGGQTIFTRADVTVKPRAGNLLVWNNLGPDGEINPRSMHQGAPVVAGAKHVITKWYRERAWTAGDEPVPGY